MLTAMCMQCNYLLTLIYYRDIADLILKYESEEEEVEDVSDVVPVGKTIPEEPAGCC